MGVMAEREESMETPPDRNGRTDTRFREISVNLVRFSEVFYLFI